MTKTTPKGYGPDDTPEDIALDTALLRLEAIISRDRGDERQMDQDLKGYVLATYSMSVSLLATLAEHPAIGRRFVEDFKRHLAHFENSPIFRITPRRLLQPSGACSVPWTGGYRRSSRSNKGIGFAKCRVRC